MMHGVTERAATLSSFSERVKNTLGNFFPFTMRTVTGDEMDTHEEADENENGEVDNFGSQVSLNCSSNENEASTNLQNDFSDRFGAVRSINNTVERKQRS